MYQEDFDNDDGTLIENPNENYVGNTRDLVNGRPQIEHRWDDDDSTLVDGPRARGMTGRGQLPYG